MRGKQEKKKFNLHSNTDPVENSPTKVVKTDHRYLLVLPEKAETDRVVIAADVAAVASTDSAYAAAATDQDVEFVQKPVVTLTDAESLAAVVPVTLATEIVASDQRQHRLQQ